MRLSAAETSFGRAIEKDPGRWDCYLAFAHTQYRYERYDSVVDLCGHILALRPGWSAEAKTRELLARALLRRRPDDYGKAFAHARRASQLALRCLLRARLVRRPAARAEDDDESRCAELAAGCLLTFSDIYSRQMRSADAIASGDVRRWHQRQIRSRVQSLSKLAPLPEGTAELQFDFGRQALAGGHLELAEEELAAAARSNPTHPEYSAGLALARATRLTDGDRKVDDPQREEIVALCLRALQGMAGAFFPSRDAQACGIVADVFDRMGIPPTTTSTPPRSCARWRMRSIASSGARSAERRSPRSSSSRCSRRRHGSRRRSARTARPRSTLAPTWWRGRTSAGPARGGKRSTSSVRRCSAPNGRPRSTRSARSPGRRWATCTASCRTSRTRAPHGSRRSAPTPTTRGCTTRSARPTGRSRSSDAPVPCVRISNRRRTTSGRRSCSTRAAASTSRS